MEIIPDSGKYKVFTYTFLFDLSKILKEFRNIDLIIQTNFLWFTKLIKLNLRSTNLIFTIF